MATNITWPTDVNNNFYDMSVNVKENIKKLSFESGKERRYLLNSSPKKTFSLSLDLWNETEETAFWNWYDNVILSGALSFKMTDLLKQTGETEYVLSETPGFEDIYPKKIKLQLEEY